MEIDRDNLAGIYLNPSGAGGGGGGTDAHVTTTQTNPVIPDAAKPLFNSMLAIATGMQGSPVNFGKIPGLDAPPTRMPTASLGNLLMSPAFMAGANRLSPLSVGGPVMAPNSGGGYTAPNYNPSGTPTAITEPTKEFTTRREQRQQNRQGRRDVRQQRIADRRMGLGDMLA